MDVILTSLMVWSRAPKILEPAWLIHRIKWSPFRFLPKYLHTNVDTYMYVLLLLLLLLLLQYYYLATALARSAATAVYMHWYISNYVYTNTHIVTWYLNNLTYASI